MPEVSTPEAEAEHFRRREQEALAGLGEYRSRVEAWIDEINGTTWLSSAGRYLRPRPTLFRVLSLSQGKMIERSSVGLNDGVSNCLNALAQRFGRLQYVEAADTLFGVRSSHYDNKDALEITTSISWDVRGALTELILADVMRIEYFRDALRWYRRGRWRCGVTEDGRWAIW